MIRIIAALDARGGLATDNGIPWDIPADKQYFARTVRHASVIMGKRTYDELTKPVSDQPNYVVTSSLLPLRDGFVRVSDPQQFLSSWQGGDVWNIGGATLYASTLDMADELYLTRIDRDYQCSRFFPQISPDFVLATRSPAHQWHGDTFFFEIWKRLPKQR